MGSSDYLIAGANKIPFSTSKARNLTIASSEYEKYDKGWDIKLVLECSSGREVGKEGGKRRKRRLLAMISAFFHLLSFSRRPV